MHIIYLAGFFFFVPLVHFELESVRLVSFFLCLLKYLFILFFKQHPPADDARKAGAVVFPQHMKKSLFRFTTFTTSTAQHRDATEWSLSFPLFFFFFF